MLIIEGTDKLGKTTLCKTLQKKIMDTCGEDVPYTHYGVRPRNFDFYNDYSKRIQPWTIADRFHYSEYAYEKAQGKEPRYSQEVLEMLCGEVLSVGGFVVLLISSTDFLMKCLKSVPDEIFENSILYRVNTLYKCLAETRLTDCKFVVEITEKHRAADDKDLVQNIASEYIKRQMIYANKI
jgi:thymidylate kinase